MVRGRRLRSWMVIAGLSLGPGSGLAAEADATRSVLRVPIGGGEELIVANADDYETAAQWFLRRADGRLRDLGEGLAGMHEVHRLLASPDA